MAAITIRVSSENIRSKSAEILRTINEIEQEFERIKSVVTASEQYWNGDASMIHQNYLQAVDKNFNEVIKRLREHPADLLQMAQIYEEGEKEAVEMANSLPVDVIT